MDRSAIAMGLGREAMDTTQVCLPASIELKKYN